MTVQDNRRNRNRKFRTGRRVWLRPLYRCSICGVMTVWLLGSGCANVKPWERDALAEYGMRPDRDPVTGKLREHMWFSREAANGGRSIGGGGCGCN